ncbi:MAG: hypothetical protein HY040_14135, partial [Planctomycetes bacterium]|nr:hypothetical protein [Planctomycetota bacterium]
MKRSTWLLLLFAGVMTASIASQAQEGQKALKPRTEAPQGECCLWRIALDGSGVLKHKLGNPHNCPTGETAQGSGYLELKPLKSPGAPCDESHRLIPDGSQLNAAI